MKGESVRERDLRAIADNGVLVAGDVHAVEDFVDLRTRQVVLADVPHHHVAVCAARDQLLSSLGQGGAHSAGIGDDLGAVGFEFRSGDNFELGGEGSNLVVVGAALEHREDSKVDLLSKSFLAKD